MFEWIWSMWDNIMWFSPPVLILMLVNFILLIVIIVKGFTLVMGKKEGYTGGSGPLDPGSVRFYYSNNCGYCIKMMPIMNELRDSMTDVKFDFVDVDIAKPTGINSFPTFIAKSSDGIMASHVGAFRDKAAAQAWITKVTAQQLLKTPATVEVNTPTGIKMAAVAPINTDAGVSLVAVVPVDATSSTVVPVTKM